MPETIIRVEGIGKKYNLGQTSSNNFREEIRARFSFKKRDQEKEGDFWALKDINFELKKGEVLGVIGKNGSGKSTLLKILSQITTPTEGKVSYSGKIASILDIGTGFHPDLSGRENVFLRGELLGITHEDIETKLEEIITFSEIGNFIEVPVKHYSSGMFLRLAFAVSMFLKADILLLDEVISVGDASFRIKCFEKLDEMVRDGVSILLVSHNFNEITSFCNRCIWLDNGKIKAIGRALDVVQKYSENTFGTQFGRKTTFYSEQEELNRSGKSRDGLVSSVDWKKDELEDNEYFRLSKVAIEVDQFEPEDIHYAKDPFSIVIEYEKRNAELDINFYMAIFHITGIPALSIVNKKPEIDKKKGIYQVKCSFPGNLLNHGNFYFSFWVGSYDGTFIDSYQKLLYFKIECNPEDENTHWREVHAHVRPDLDWEWMKLS